MLLHCPTRSLSFSRTCIINLCRCFRDAFVFSQIYRKRSVFDGYNCDNDSTENQKENVNGPRTFHCRDFGSNAINTPRYRFMGGFTSIKTGASRVRYQRCQARSLHTRRSLFTFSFSSRVSSLRVISFHFFFFRVVSFFNQISKWSMIVNHHFAKQVEKRR